MKIRKILAGIACAALVTFGTAAPAEAAYSDCAIPGFWGAWRNADFGGSGYLCRDVGVGQYPSIIDNEASSIINRADGFVYFYKEPNFQGTDRLKMPSYFSHNNLKKQGINDVFSSTKMS
ncbi:MAG: peptidase inhibitor family I36 protein [Bifidobacteriaceae bacterium]|nr:peptidase inhibitor family I36 protein [Bifidobacteriaceae bacterium]